MIRYIKLIFYLLGMYTPTSLIDKIYILRHRSINMYTTTISNKRVTSIEKDIVTYNYILDKYNQEDMVTRYIKIPNMRNNTITTYSRWYSDSNNNMLTDYELYNWLTISEIFVLRFMLYNSEVGEGIAYSNSIKLQPYIINIENIVDDILKYT